MTAPLKARGPGSQTARTAAAEDPRGLPARRTVIEAEYVRLILAAAERRGCRVDAILERARIDPRDLTRAGAKVTQSQFAALVSRLTRVTRDEMWGLGRTPLRPGTFELLCRLLVQCRSLGEALRTGMRFYHGVTGDFTVRMREEAGQAHIWIVDATEDEAVRRMLHGTVVFFLYGLMCWLVGRRIALDGIDFVHAEAPQGTALDRLLGTPVRYGRQRTELRLRSRLLLLPVIPDQQRLSRFITSVPEALLVLYRDDTSATERVRGYLRKHLADPTSLDDVAQAVGISSPTLRRRIRDEEQQNFQALKDRVRLEAADELMQDERHTLDDIARRLGFSELSTFHRAFKRWTGETPGGYRARNRHR